MRVLGFASAVSLALSANAIAAAPRVASMNLCTDELLFLLARPDQIVSVTHLARDSQESVFWRMAQRYPANNGSILAVARYRPNLILAMDGLGRDHARLSEAIGAELVILPLPNSLDEVETAISTVAALLGREARGRRFVSALRSLQRTIPTTRSEGMFLSGSGQTYPAGSLGAQWLALAGVQNTRSDGYTVRAEDILRDPPPLVIRSTYHASRTSRSHQWLGYRFLAQSRSTRTLRTDGRLWTCAGLSLLPEILRLRREIAS
jgi:iron complex transport system substrate-binding protein